MGARRMAVVLTKNDYGKSRIRLTKVTRHLDRNDLAEWTVDIQLSGDFEAAYTAGDNRLVVATDTMKNRVYVHARDWPLSSPEDFAIRLAGEFLEDYSQVTSASVRIAVQPWERIAVADRPHPHAFVGGGPGLRTCSVIATRSGRQVFAGVEDLPIMKSTDSAFRDFYRDEYTTLPDTDERILATLLSAEWLYTAADLSWTEQYDRIRRVLLETFALHQSLGVQQTLHAMGSAVLDGCPDVEEIALTMPNRHRLLVNLQPFDRDNPNEVFVATDEPYGLISGTLRRE